MSTDLFGIHTQDPWDVLIAGAGPAGSFAAHQLARSGARVLLVDRARFPRTKACGCCLSAAGIDVLDKAGLSDRLTASGAIPLDHYQLTIGRSTARIPYRGGMAISRDALDTALARAAVDAGAHFLDAASARLAQSGPDGDQVATLTREDQSNTIRTKVCIAADGIAGSFLNNTPALAPQIQPSSRMGLATAIPSTAQSPPPGLLHMIVSNHGYVGLVRLPGQRTQIAACIDPEALRNAGSPTSLITAMLTNAGSEFDLTNTDWHATPRLTRHRLPGAPGVFIIGDAAGYIEPFTGEGMTWALAAAQAVVPCIATALQGDPAAALQQWTTARRQLLTRPHATCRLITNLVKQVWPIRVAISLAKLAPLTSSFAITRLIRTPPIRSSGAIA